MKILALETGLFPDGETLGAALDSIAGAEMTTIDLTTIDAADRAAWEKVARAVLGADLVVTK